MNQNHLSYLINNLESRWEEISILLECARNNENVNTELHDAICRSVSILMVANLEGFYKDLIKAIITDLNENNSFETLPSEVQRSYCKNFIDSSSSSRTAHLITDKLIEEFNRLDANIDYKPFLFLNNKNPKPSVIKAIFENLGIKKIFKTLDLSRYDEAFQDEARTIERKNQVYIEELKVFTECFPYKIQSLEFNNDSGGSGKTLWEEFLDEINYRRHEIAHGNESSNIDSVPNLIKTKNKIICLQLALIHVLVEQFGQSVESELETES